jgi:hypothetical protein
MTRTPLRIALLTVLLGAAAPGLADELDELRKLRDTTITLVNLLVEQGVITREKADALIAQAQQAGASGAAPKPSAPAVAASAAPPVPAAPVAPGVVRVPYVPESVRQEISAQVEKDVLAQAKTERWGEPGAFPDWLNHVTWSGDIRLREEADRFPTDNTPNASAPQLQAYGVNIVNSTEANNRTRVRARFGLEATVGDTVTVGMRLATGGVGAGSNPGSENQTLGSYETRSTVGFDRAYIEYRPESWLALSGGRLGNPFFSPTTLIWANDLSFEGFTLHVEPRFGPHWQLFATAGALPILQNDPTPTVNSPSKWLYAFQSGFDLRFNDQADWRLAAAVYDYRHIEGVPNPTIVSTVNSGTAAAFRQTGNTVFDINYQADQGTPTTLYGLASRFHELNLSTSLDFGFVGPTHLMLDGDWVKNLGFDQTEILRRTGFAVLPQVRGWQSRLAIGYPTLAQKHAWQAWIGYRYVQRDATLDAFTDQDFHLGGTDAKGYYVGARWAFDKNSTIGLRWFTAKQIDGVELAGADSQLSGLPLAIDVLQLDVTSSF